MQIIINGESHQVPERISITALLQHLEVDARQIAVEKGGEIVMRSRYDITPVQAGDSIELVEFVGGG